MTGQPETSPGFSTMGVSGGQIVTRRVNLRADHPQMLAAILPHEVTHVVLADVFTEQQIPRWADEGMAVLAEPATEQAGRAADLQRPLGRAAAVQAQPAHVDRLPRVQALEPVLRPERLTDAIPGRAGDRRRSSSRSSRTPNVTGPETAVREVYKFEGLDDLEARWREYARRQASRVATVDSPLPADSVATQRQ